GRRSMEKEKEGQHVYYLAKGSKTPRAIETNLKQPNGIFGIAASNTLFVADIGDGKTYQYTYQDDGTLTNRTVFAAMGSDGMTVDQKGNVYLTGKKGVTVYNKKGEEIGVVEIPANWTANVCFGGKEMKTLYITSMDGLYAVEMRVKGLR
ncbi:MAG: SMP-30/gluconolactonase/LRE family protein, partial [Cyclobacteriaceae bacterium]|nr:SMP-30/gluconolactonase/LRE family protein [Cyclobacteriaceae bacterium]